MAERREWEVWPCFVDSPHVTSFPPANSGQPLCKVREVLPEDPKHLDDFMAAHVRICQKSTKLAQATRAILEAIDKPKPNVVNDETYGWAAGWILEVMRARCDYQQVLREILEGE